MHVCVCNVQQIDRTKKNKPHILIGTPGRLCELALEKKRVKLGGVKFVVLDEVDTLMRAPYE
jgi:superfamily II DNA/RNA helicase